MSTAPAQPSICRQVTVDRFDSWLAFCVFRSQNEPFQVAYEAWAQGTEPEYFYMSIYLMMHDAIASFTRNGDNVIVEVQVVARETGDVLYKYQRYLN